MPPSGFTWVDKPHVAGLAYPESAADLNWLRRNGIDILITLTEHPVRRDWANEAGMLVVNVPVPDMEPPTERQLDHLLDTIRKANASQMGVAVHCGAGLGRTDASANPSDRAQGRDSNAQRDGQVARGPKRKALHSSPVEECHNAQ